MATKTTNKVIFRISAAGECPRSLAAPLLGYEPEAKPAWLDKAADEGRWHEDRLVQELITEGNLVTDRQSEVKLEYDNFILLGHIDGKITDASGTKLLEIKSMSQYEFDRWMKGRFNEFPEYADQLACYMEATGLAIAEYYVKNRNLGTVHKSDIWFDDNIIGDFTPAERVQVVTTKLAMVADCVLRKELPPAVCDMSTIQCKRCSYKYLCIKTKDDMVIQNEATLFKAAQEWRRGKALEKQARQLLESARTVFEEHTIASKLQNWQFDDLVISNVTVKEHEVPARIQKEYSYIKIEDLRKEA